MEYRELNRNESNERMQIWIQTGSIPVLNDEELKIRKYLLSEFRRIRDQYSGDNYKTDLNFGIVLYTFLAKSGGFTMRTAASDGFWRYMSLMIIPDAVSERWGKDNETHFWSMGIRIWLRQIWWYVYLGLQKKDNEERFDLTKTYSTLSGKGFTTDEILNLVERTGRKGTYVEVYREIVRKYSLVSDAERLRHRDPVTRKSLFRKIMILNTAKSVTVDPYLFGVREYVDELFEDLEVHF